MKQIKITTQITKNGYTTTLSYKGKEYVQEWKRTNTGAICVKEFPADIPEELIENITDPYILMDLKNDEII